MRYRVILGVNAPEGFRDEIVMRSSEVAAALETSLRLQHADFRVGTPIVAAVPGAGDGLDLVDEINEIGMTDELAELLSGFIQSKGAPEETTALLDYVNDRYL